MLVDLHNRVSLWESLCICIQRAILTTSIPLKKFRAFTQELHVRSLFRKKNIFLSGKVTVRGIPILDIRKDCRLEIGNAVLLNSQNPGYHINMYAPVKLYVNGPSAYIRIGENTRIHGSCLHASDHIEIGQNCLIAANCHIIDCNGHDLSFPNVDNRIHTKGACRPVRIEDNVWIGGNTFVLPGVTIGHGSVISANSVVSKDIPPMVLAGGNPAVVIKKFEEANPPYPLQA